ncbi:MAG TPA: DUF2268 domain-containing putative Zn-dependent protease [Pyrinomonadaceae bacterium]|nr:DUF2268 domain-containing putative Zn-dependent protease [Pyrinomonadaceae bacterium]
MPRTITLTICILFLSTVCIAQSGPTLNKDPETVKFVTSDIGNFWQAYDLAAKETDKAKRIAIFQTEYLEKGSPGLKDFLRLRIRSAETLVDTIDRMPKYYASIRPQTLQVQRMEKRMRAAFKKFKSIYPEAVFPDVYFLIGVTSSGGTTGPSGLLIGTEMYGKTAKTPMDELSAWLKVVLSSVDNVPAIVAHESCHYNQRYNTAEDQRHLLGKALQEGACDTIGELISGRNINDHLKVYGKTHDAEIWRDFEADMYKPDFSKWVYNAMTAKDRPADLGYYVGYLITQAYYRNAKDKRKAVYDILNIQDARAFYEASGVRQKTVSDK